MPEYVVYVLDWTPLGGKQYVGMTANLHERLVGHRYQPPSCVASAWDLGSPDVHVVRDGLSREDAEMLERSEIASRDCCNVRPGGGGKRSTGRRDTVSCAIDQADHDRLTRVAAERKWSLAQVVREAVLTFLRESEAS